MNRWWIYQRERFPLLAHGPLVLAFSASAVSFSALLRGPGASPSLAAGAVAFVTSLASFLQLRIADEFKDADEDARHRPYRPVPRGLVKLRELGAIGAGLAGLQLGLCLWLGSQAGGLRWQLPALLLVTWGYFALMSVEFFARDWLKARPVAYLFSHMLIMPLIDWYATGCDWVPAQGAMPAGLFWFLAASFCNGLVIELGRKIRAPEQEESGVQTYTVLWGRTGATAAWLAAMAATLACALGAEHRIGFLAATGVVLGGLLAAGAGLGIAFVRTARGRLARGIEVYSGVWTLVLYLVLGVAPLAWRALSR
jgi:4-hydroxybenzoate polyprenyltransferase